jgi:hypothetical protein
MNRSYGESILSQRAGFIRTEHVDAGSFTDGGKPGWKDIEHCQSLRAESPA